MADSVKLQFQQIHPDRSDTIGIIDLIRPHAANAFNADVINEMLIHLQKVHAQENCRALILRGQGKHFSAGADLQWMKDSAKLNYEENQQDATLMMGMFQNFDMLHVPTISIVHGAIYGGAVGLVAASDIAIAVDTAKFCLSEVKLGLLPAVILPYLARKMKPGQLRRHALSGRVFSAQEAYDYGLVEMVTHQERLQQTLNDELNNLLSCNLQAQRQLKNLHARITCDSFRQGEHTVDAISQARTSEDGQQGLQAFFNKERPPWSMSVPDNWSLEDG